MRSIVWFREDLRIHDHPALHHACKHHESVIALFIIDTASWKAHDIAACRVDFILRGLIELSRSLSKLNIPLLIETVIDTQEIPALLLKIMQHHSASTLYFNKQYEINELRRDKLVVELLQKHQLTAHSFDDQLILPPNQVLTQQGENFKVFTAYKRAWYQFLRQHPINLLPPVKPRAALDIKPAIIPNKLPGFHSHIPSQQWPAGEAEAIKRLKNFIADKIYDYALQRDYPSASGTSQLSPYLTAGMISPRQCLLAALHNNHDELDSGNKGAITWMTELIWRDFYKQILISTPRVSMHKAYQQDTDKITWHENNEHLLAWQTGQTGVPIVDAAMRQLNATGWMHNRLRMITAMYFTKNLFLNWRLGEKYFMQNLIDGDLAANNGGWQWSASTGTDAAPYFRVFNPIRQSERFDPQGKFIRIFCEELRDIPLAAIHNPYAHAKELMQQSTYPKPIVDLKQSRTHAIAAFRSIKNLS